MRNILFNVLVLCLVFLFFQATYAQTDQSTPFDLLYNDFSDILKERSWNIDWSGNELKAYRYKDGYQELRVTIATDNGEIVTHTVTVSHNSTVLRKQFKFRNTDNTPENIRKIVLPYLVKVQQSPHEHEPSKTYTASAFMGYSRFHDTYIMPRQPKGTFILGFNLVYNPSRYSTLTAENLGTGDYLSFSFYISADNNIRENTYDIHYLLTGTRKYETNNDTKTSTISGLFMGVEYFRPVIDFDAFTWDESIYRHHPHIQYFIFRTFAWEYLYEKDSGFVRNFNVMAACGPSVNSSLNATKISPEEEGELSKIFRSNFYGDRRQNFYYSIGIPLKIELTLQFTDTISVDTSWRSYFFFPIEGENAYDVANITRMAPAYHFTESLSSKLAWEFWHVHSMLEDNYKNHYWNRIIITMEYNL